MLSPVASSFSAADSFSHSINPDVIYNSELKKKKKKKRLHDDEQIETPQGTKKKKRKHDKESLGEVIQGPSTNLEPLPEPPLVKKKKKAKGTNKEKDKQKEKMAPLAHQTDAEIEASSQASAAALLSAIVATMSNPQAALPHMQPPMSYGPHLSSPPPRQHFVPFPAIPFAFPVPNDAVPHPNPFSILAMNPASNGAPLSELALGSNEDILRALQEIDIGNLTAALKNIGDNGATPSLVTPGTAPSPDASLPVTHIPDAPIAKKSVSKNGHKRTIDMSLPSGEELINPAHAHVLATKWLNASKLAELVREEGIIIFIDFRLDSIRLHSIIGLVYKKGKFSAIEEQQLRTAIQAYQKAGPLLLILCSMNRLFHRRGR